jgi:hypothetical protein
MVVEQVRVALQVSDPLSRRHRRLPSVRREFAMLCGAGAEAAVFFPCDRLTARCGAEPRRSVAETHQPAMPSSMTSP